MEQGGIRKGAAFFVGHAVLAWRACQSGGRSCAVSGVESPQGETAFQKANPMSEQTTQHPELSDAAKAGLEALAQANAYYTPEPYVPIAEVDAYEDWVVAA